jgi:ABC-type transport system involved in multi-copper enzyme maturation permease subunit
VRDLLLAEWMKSRTRWLPYVLFFFMLLGAAMHAWLLGYLQYWDVTRDGRDVSPEDVSFALRTLAFPWSLTALLDGGQFWGALLVGVIVSSVVATEYNWGTVRQAIARGQARDEWLFVKLFGSALFASALLLAAFAAGVVLLLWANATAGIEITLDAPGGGVNLFEVVLLVLRAGYAVVPYGMLAFFLAVVGRSTALGATGVILFVIIEAIVVAILGDVPDPGPSFRVFFPGYGVMGLLDANRIDAGSYGSMALRDPTQYDDGPGAWGGFALVTLYSALLLIGAWYVFRRRDLRLGTGE